MRKVLFGSIVTILDCFAIIKFVVASLKFLFFCANCHIYCIILKRSLNNYQNFTHLFYVRCYFSYEKDIEKVHEVYLRKTMLEMAK